MQIIIIGIILELSHFAGGVATAIYANGLWEVGGSVHDGLATSAVSLILL